MLIVCLLFVVIPRPREREVNARVNMLAFKSEQSFVSVPTVIGVVNRATVHQQHFQVNHPAPPTPPPFRARAALSIAQL